MKNNRYLPTLRFEENDSVTRGAAQLKPIDEQEPDLQGRVES